MKNNFWAKKDLFRKIMEGEKSLGKERCYELVESTEKIYKKYLKSYTNEYINYLMSDDYFWDNPDLSKSERIKIINNFLFNREELYDWENGITEDEGYVEKIEDVINSKDFPINIETDYEEEFVEDLFWILHIIGLQTIFNKKYGNLL